MMVEYGNAQIGCVVLKCQNRIRVLAFEEEWSEWKEGQLIALSVIYPEFFKKQEEFLANLNRLFEEKKIDHFDVEWNKWVVYK